MILKTSLQNHALLLCSSLLFTAHTASASPCLPDAVNFNDTLLYSFQPQDVDTLAISVEEGCSVYLSGNTWVATQDTFTLTENTILKFGFYSSSPGEIQAVGLESVSVSFPYPLGARYFSVAGSQRAHFGHWRDFKYAEFGVYQEFSIPLRDYSDEYTFEGDDFRLVLVMDQDEDTGGDAYFDNIRLVEEPQEPSTLPAPQNLQTIQDNDGLTTLTWDPVEGAVGYYLQAIAQGCTSDHTPGPEPTATPCPIATPLPPQFIGDITEYEIGALRNFIYTYRIAATRNMPETDNVFEGGSGLLYAQITVRGEEPHLPAPDGPLPAPEGLEIESIDDMNTLIWSPVEGAVGYYLNVEIRGCRQPEARQEASPKVTPVPTVIPTVCPIPSAAPPRFIGDVTSYDISDLNQIYTYRLSIAASRTTPDQDSLHSLNYNSVYVPTRL